MPPLRRMLAVVSLLLAWSLSTAAVGTHEEALAAYDEAIASRDVNDQRYATAYAIWTELAADGHPGAQYHLGMLQWFGLGGAEQNQSEALDLIQASARGGYPTAQAFLGFLYENGVDLVLDQDRITALKLYYAAAQSGQCAAVRRMEQAYTDGGLGIEPDPAQAAEWRARLPGCTKR